MSWHPRRAKRRPWPRLLQTAWHFRRHWEGGPQQFARNLRWWAGNGETAILEGFQRYWRGT